MKDPLRLTNGLLEWAIKNVRQSLPIILSAMKTKIHLLLMDVYQTFFFQNLKLLK
jgi:hypothetical protein